MPPNTGGAKGTQGLRINLRSNLQSDLLLTHLLLSSQCSEGGWNVAEGSSKEAFLRTQKCLSFAHS